MDELVDCSRTISEAEFRRIVRYMKSHYGINLEAKKVLVTGRLSNYLQMKGYHSYDEYMCRVEQDTSGEEAHKLIEYLTTNHTYFLREPLHFEYLRKHVLPQLTKSERRTKCMRIWSAASSTGEEAYTIAMTIGDYLRGQCDLNIIEPWDTRILATDISEKVLAQADQGIYSREQIEHLPLPWQHQYFRKLSSDQYRVTQELRKEVILRQFNLMDPFTFKNRFHVIFLRNVMIYFDEATRVSLLEKIYDFMEPGGYLFIGMTETLDRDKTRLEYLQPSIYRKGATA